MSCSTCRSLGRVIADFYLTSAALSHRENSRLLWANLALESRSTSSMLFGWNGLTQSLFRTTLLNVLAQRVTMGVVHGDILVNNHDLPASFQRQCGYAQQQDLHLEQSTVREALQFSALLRQPASTPKQEKLDYVEEIIDLLEMRSYAEAIVGEPGAGLGVEQRKKLTIGVELAAKPSLLLFLDEPTSGLDSQSAVDCF